MDPHQPTKPIQNDLRRAINALARQMYAQHAETVEAIREVALKINPERARADERLWRPIPKCPDKYLD